MLLHRPDDPSGCRRMASSGAQWPSVCLLEKFHRTSRVGDFCPTGASGIPLQFAQPTAETGTASVLIIMILTTPSCGINPRITEVAKMKLGIL